VWLCTELIVHGHLLSSHSARSSLTPHSYVGVSTVHYGLGALSVYGNVIRGSNDTRDTALSYDPSGPGTLVVLSASNLVVDVPTPRVVGQRTRLEVSGY
jgi:hypothetical protein